MPVFQLTEPIRLVDLLHQAGIAGSKSDARRLVQQGGVRLGADAATNVVTDVDYVIPVADAILQVGKRRFLHLVP